MSQALQLDWLVVSARNTFLSSQRACDEQSIWRFALGQVESSVSSQQLVVVCLQYGLEQSRHSRGPCRLGSKNTQWAWTKKYGCFTPQRAQSTPAK